MANVALYNMEGKEVGTVELNDSVFGIEVNEAAVFETVKNYLANQRQGTQSTKTRSEVSGGGIKPFRQKGTGRARQGSTRATQWIHGGIALGPKPRDYRYSVNKKMKQLALKSVLSSKVAEGKIAVIDSIKIEEIKTKTVVSMLKALEAENILTPSPDGKHTVQHNFDGHQKRYLVIPKNKAEAIYNENE